jgi:hypothetical protein
MTQKYAFIAAHASIYPVSVICRVLGLARSGYYAWKRGRTSARAERDAPSAGRLKPSSGPAARPMAVHGCMPRCTQTACGVRANAWRA